MAPININEKGVTWCHTLNLQGGDKANRPQKSRNPNPGLLYRIAAQLLVPRQSVDEGG